MTGNVRDAPSRQEVKYLLLLLLLPRTAGRVLWRQDTPLQRTRLGPRKHRKSCLYYLMIKEIKKYVLFI